MNPTENPSLFQKLDHNTSVPICISCKTVSNILQTHDVVAAKTRAHIIQWFLHPDKGSPFDRKTKHIRHRLPKSCIIPLMRLFGYNGIIALWGEEIIGHAFFQQHSRKTGSELHLFSIAVHEELQGRGIGTKIAQTFIELGRSGEKIEKLRIGGGGDETVKAIFQKVASRSLELGINTNENFFITFGDREARPVNLIAEPRNPVNS